MKNKSPKEKSPRKSIFVTCKAIEVTDPAEFAELERRVRAAEKAMRRAGARKAKPSRGK